MTIALKNGKVISNIVIANFVTDPESGDIKLEAWRKGFSEATIYDVADIESLS